MSNWYGCRTQTNYGLEVGIHWLLGEGSRKGGGVLPLRCRMYEVFIEHCVSDCESD